MSSNQRTIEKLLIRVELGKMSNWLHVFDPVDLDDMFDT